MAQVPANPAAPDVQQSAQPAPQVSVNAPAEAFGANVAGAGLDDFAKSLGVTSQEMSTAALQLQAVNNKTAADANGTSTIQKQAEVESDYRTKNPGLAAQANLPQLYKQLDDIRQDGSTGLSPLAAADYQSYTRSMQSRLISQTVSWAADEGKKASLGASDGKIAQYQALGAADFNNPDNLNTAVQGIAGEVAFQSQRLGLTPDQGAALLHEKVGAIYQSGIHQSIDAGDFLTAQDIFTAHKADMTLAQIDSVAGALKVGANSFTVKGFGEDIAAGIIPQDRRPIVATGDNASYLGALHTREGSDQNPYSSATGTDQFVDHTWLGLMKGDPQFQADVAGKSDAQILALRSNPALADRAALAYASQNAAALKDAGLPTTNANIGLAHGYGSGGAIALLKADPAAPVSSIIGDQTAANNRVAGMTVGQVVGQFNTRFGPGDFNGSAPAPSRFSEPPPKITPNEDPDQIRSDYAAYDHRAAVAMFGDNPPLAQQAEQSANSLIDIHIRQVATQQTATFNQLDNWVISGLPGGKAVASMGDLPASAVASLPPALQSRLGEDINRAVAGYGAFKTPQMETNAASLEGMAYSNPAAFADPSRTNIGAMDLSAADRVKFIGLQGSVGKSLENQQARTEKLNAITSDPVVAAQIKTIAPTAADRTSANAPYMTYLGSLMGAVEKEEQANAGKPLPPQRIEAIAQQLALSHTTSKGFFGIGASSAPNYTVPASEEADIRKQANASQAGLGDQLTPNQVAEIYYRTHGAGQ